MKHNAVEAIEKHRSLLSGKRLGLLTNPTGVTHDLCRTADILSNYGKLVALFGPEHGISGAAQAGVKVASSVDEKTGVPVYSMYDKTGVTEEVLREIDLMVYDIRDVGLRFYTYIYTLSDMMRLCSRAGVPLLVLDSVNPLGLEKAEGTLLDESFSSGVGRFELPTRYALTVGEYARYVNGEKQIGCELVVAECNGLRRSTRPELKPFVPPSPNIPTYDSIFAYAATCPFEGTNLSEGRGSTTPFSIIGAPWLRSREIAEEMNRMKLPGVIWQASDFLPYYSKHKEVLCHGIRMHISDREAFIPFASGMLLLDLIRKTHDEFGFLYWPSSDVYFIDHLLGGDKYRRECTDVKAFIEEEQKRVDSFMKKIERYKIYE